MRDEQVEVFNRQNEVLNSLSEEIGKVDEKRKREERGLWTKVHELTRTLKERVPAERREVLEAAEQNLERGLDRRVSDARKDMQKELFKHLEIRSREMRDDMQKNLSVQIDKQAKDALAKIDGRADLWSEELRRSEEKHAHNEAQLLTKRTVDVETHCEAIARSCIASCEVQEHAISEVEAKSLSAVAEVKDELRAFIGEQRVFSGFLDAEQKSYQELMELMRQEVRALSRLLHSDSGLNATSASQAAALVDAELFPCSAPRVA
jgi:hypothetical protein